MEAEKATRKAKKEEEKRVRLLLKQQAKVEKKPKAPSVRDPSNKSFYPVYQKVMMRLAVEFVTRMKEDKDSAMYKKFIGLVIQHVSAVNTSVRTITVDDIWQMIKDGNCTYVTGEDEEDSDADEVFSPRDVEKTFKDGELTTKVQDEISRCFKCMAEAHSKVLLPVSLVVHIVDFYVMWLHCIVLGNVVRVTLDCTGSYVLSQ